MKSQLLHSFLLSVSLGLLLPLVVACPSSKDDTGAGDDTDADTDADSDTDSDSDSDSDADLSSIEIAASATALSSREWVTFTVQGNYSDKSSADVTSDAVFSTSDAEILDFYGGVGMGVPMGGGTVTVTASLEGFEDSVELNIELVGPEPGDLIINELLVDATVDGDPNGDGTTDPVEDEFVEIANLSGGTVGLAGLILAEDEWSTWLPRHTFAEGVLLRPGQAVVVFGGGDVGALSAENVQFFTVDNDDPSTPYGLSLRDAGETLQVIDSDGKTVLAAIAWGSSSLDGTVPAVLDASLTLDPDLYGKTYVDHSVCTDSVGAYSPGTFCTGGSFPGPAGFLKD